MLSDLFSHNHCRHTAQMLPHFLNVTQTFLNAQKLTTLISDCCVTEFWLFTPGKTSNPSLAWKNVDIFKINDYDDDAIINLEEQGGGRYNRIKVVARTSWCSYILFLI